jgi:hypothetical protein
VRPAERALRITLDNGGQGDITIDRFVAEIWVKRDKSFEVMPLSAPPQGPALPYRLEGRSTKHWTISYADLNLGASATVVGGSVRTVGAGRTVEAYAGRRYGSPVIPVVIYLFVVTTLVFLLIFLTRLIFLARG